ncbi:MAG: GspE/PulE/PilB domain-containing protein [Thermoleophilia bacterium]
MTTSNPGDHIGNAKPGTAMAGPETIVFDERLPVPPELLEGLDPEALSRELIFPVFLEGGTVVLAAADPGRVKPAEIARIAKDAPYELRRAPAEDIRWYIEDYLSDRPGRIIGTERTGLAFWRNTMAAWRTRMACYRNDLAKARVSLSILRWGLGFITVASASAVLELNLSLTTLMYWSLLVAGAAVTLLGLFHYLRIRRSMMKAPGPQTLVEVTTATVSFLEDYELQCTFRPAVKGTMLSRLAEFLPNYCSVLRPEPASRERTHLARERDMLAAHRTLAGCYRTLYARGRTGLAFIRTGIVFLGIGAGLVQYFQVSPVALWGLLLIAAGVLMIVDGLLWYVPARKEEPDLRRLMTTPARQA